MDEPEQSSTTDEPSPRLRALVVDDHPTNRIVMQAILGQLGCDVGVACNGVEGVEAASAQPFDLVVMDRNMPGRGGDEAARLIRALPSASSSAFIVRWTTDPPDRQVRASYDDTLDKPVTFTAVIAMLQRAADRRLDKASGSGAARAA
jgi:CheY-like chemotaxis protein